jgi:histidine triad (HIT) family protein
MSSCIFCEIAAHQSPAHIIYEDDQALAFLPLAPIAPVHLLIIPRKHIESVNALLAEDEAVLGYLVSIARKLAEQEGVSRSGYRLVTNTGPDAGQTVFHLHFHLIGGRHMPFRFE